ncbi:uncharacterized protein LOC129947273 [Eupeodes corollae]|uniref:uncharacterized protein LOC129947273 n=1 Tax=Eupeodes corollae TaxID=290404 RepID=UPI002490F8CC|nr:uncharacterized protein LOC129947273 [Eupeodes corollae]
MDAKTRALNFVENANVHKLKTKLGEMGLSSQGIKNALKSRLNDAITSFETDRIEEFFPHDDTEEGDEHSNDDNDDELDEESASVTLRLEKLREILKKKQEISDLERRISELNGSARDARPSSMYSARDIEDSLPTFCGDDDYPIKKWVEVVDDAIITYRFTESESFIYPKRLLKGTAKLFLRSRSFKSWGELKGALLREFHNHTTATDVHNALRNRKKRRDENFLQYVLAMQEIASSAEIDEQDVITYIIKGIPDSLFNKQLMLTANTVAELKVILRKYEKMRAESQPTTSGYTSKPFQQAKPLLRIESKVKCYNCNEVGHISTKCPKPKRERGSCFRCGKKGHVISECSEKASVLVVQNKDPLKESTISTLLADFKGVLEFELKCSEAGSIQVNMHLPTIIDTGSPISFIQQQFVPPCMMTAIDVCTHNFVGINNSKMNVLDYDNDDDFNFEILKIDTCDTRDEKTCLNINENLSYEEKLKLEKIVFESIKDNQNYADDYEMKIVLTDSNSPFSCAPRRLPYVHKIELQKVLDNLLKENIIRESNSPYASPIVLTRKKNGEMRLCVDYRQLNKVTVKDNFPLPLIEDHLDRLRDKRYFTLLDLKSGFHHVKMNENSVKFTSFVTPLGQFEYLRMPFGLKNAPSVFQRYINNIFKELINSGKLLIYIDDLLVATETKEDHFSVLKEVLDVVSEHSLQLRLDKCVFMHEQIKYLGYEVSANGIGPNVDGLKAVADFPLPTNPKKLHSFLGLCSYFRKFIRDFSLLAKPLLRKDTQFVLGEEQIKSFNTLKEKLLHAPLLSIYNPYADTELHCDASSLGFGAVLLQRQQDKKLHPIFFFSKRSTDPESRYHSYELETLAIIYALRRFRIYLTGIRFKIVTDCRSLTQTLNKKILNPRISRWALELQDYDYVIEHRDSKRMNHVDALSRCQNILIVEPDTFEHALAAAQQNDPIIKRLVEMLEKRDSSGYELINGLLYLDGFSKYVKLYAVKSTTTKEVMQCLESYFSFYSKPTRIVSDRGSCFTSEDFASFCEKYDIKHVKIATSSPQSNGQVERINRCLTPMLSKECEIDSGIWVKSLQKVEFALNNTENKSTAKSPSMLLFGVAQKGIISDNVKEFLDENIIEHAPRDLEQIRKEATVKTVESQNQNKIYFDKRHKKPHQYKIGDFVLIKNVVNTPGLNKKFLAKYKGPFEIIKILPNDRYIIKDLENLQISRIPYEGVCCPENMKPYIHK